MFMVFLISVSSLRLDSSDCTLSTANIYLWLVMPTTEEVGTHAVVAAVQARPCTLGALGIWKEFPSEMRQLVGRREHTRLHHGCCQHQTRRCLHPRCRRGRRRRRRRPALHDTSRISSGTHSSSGNNTMHAVWSSTGRKPNKAFMFSHFLRIV